MSALFISIIVGLGLGLAFASWALYERFMRFKIEKRISDLELKYKKRISELEAERKRLDFIARNHQVSIHNAEEQHKRLVQHLHGMRSTLNATRLKLAQCGDSEAIKQWLDQELDNEEL